MQPLVLKSVVENNRIERAEFCEQFDAVDSAPRDRDRSAERFREHRWFVAGFLVRDFHHPAIGDQERAVRGRRALVSAADNPDLQTMALQAARKKQCEWSLAVT